MTDTTEPATHYASSTAGTVSDIQPRIACGSARWQLVSDDLEMVTCQACQRAAAIPAAQPDPAPPAALQLDLLCAVSRLAQLQDELVKGHNSYAGWLLEQRVLTCDLPRLRDHLTAETMTWAARQHHQLQPRATDTRGCEIVSERWWTGTTPPVCVVLLRDPHRGLKAYIGGSENASAVRWHGARVDPGLGQVLFPAFASRKWAEW